MPVFEAIVNSIHALEDRQAEDGEIWVDIIRGGRQLSLHAQPSISGFAIRDNGAGFTERNFLSFKRAESSYKRARGGKGVGRFMWLAAFREARVESTFHEDGKCMRRTFRFAKDIEGGIDDLETVETKVEQPPGSTVELVDVAEELTTLRWFPKDAQRVADAVAEHCTGYLLNPSCPAIRVTDGPDTIIDVNKLFSSSSAERSAGSFVQAGHDFSVVVIKAKPKSGDSPHRVRLCADYREVKSYSLGEDLPQLPRKVWDGEHGNRWVAEVYVSGRYLDRHVDSERSRFRFEEFDSENTELFDGQLSMRQLRKSVAERVEVLLKEFVEPERERWRQTVRDHISSKSPRYGVLLKVANQELDALPPDLSADRLEGDLARLLFQHRQRLETSLATALESDVPIQAHVSSLLTQVQDVQRDQLAEYVMRRHATLRYLKSALFKNAGTEKWPFERVLHDIIFPRREDSTTIDPDRANLWVLDERLSFGDEVLSDRPLDIEDPAAPEPDIAVFDRVVTVGDGIHPRSVIMFEFKRPGRDDFGPYRGKDPVGQLQDQVYRLREGPITTPVGRTGHVPDSVPIYVYLVADATPTLLKALGRAGWIPGADKQSHAWIDTQNRAIYQHLTWAELLEGATQRNDGFFQQLNLPAP